MTPSLEAEFNKRFADVEPTEREFFRAFVIGAVEQARLEERERIKEEILGLYAFVSGQGWKGEEAFRMVEGDLLKLARKLSTKEGGEGK